MQVYSAQLHGIDFFCVEEKLNLAKNYEKDLIIHDLPLC